MLPSDDGTTSLSNTSIEKVAIIAFLIDDRRDSPCGPDTGPTRSGIPEVDAYSPPAILEPLQPLNTPSCVDKKKSNHNLRVSRV